MTDNWGICLSNPLFYTLNAKVARSLDDRLRNMGNICPRNNRHDVRRPQSTLMVTQTDAVLRKVDDELGVRSRVLARQLHSSKSSVYRLLRSEGLHPFRFKSVQGLKPNDCQKRMGFCEWLLQQQSIDNASIAHILWTDEACFTRDAVFNHHNSHMGSQVNPNVIRPQNH